MQLKCETDFDNVYNYIRQITTDLRYVDCIEAGVPSNEKEITKYAIQNELGLGNHPQRPFLSWSFQDLKDKIIDNIKKSILQGDYIDACYRSAKEMEAKIKEYIESDMISPNSDKTIAMWAEYMNMDMDEARELKQTLIFTGKMLKSIKGDINGI